MNESINPSQLSASLTQASSGWISSMGSDLQDIALRITKAVGIPETDDSLQKAIDEFKPETLGDAVEMASAAMDALADNPVTAKLLNGLEDALGISIRTPLQMAQMLMAGGNSPVMRIALAMFRFPSDANNFLSDAREVLDYAKTIRNLIQTYGDNNFWKDDLSITSIPDDALSAVSQAKTNLIVSIKEPYNEGLYQLGLDKIKEASQILSNMRVTVSIPTIAPGPAAAKIAIQSLLDLMQRKYKSLKILSVDLTSKAVTIQTTSLAEQSSAKIFSATQTGIQELRSLVAQMNATNVIQVLYVPQYLIALNKIYNVLQFARPVVSPPPPYFPGNTFAFPGLLVQKILADIRKIYVLSTKPMRVDLFSAFITSLETNIAQLSVEFSSCESQINILWTYMPGVLDSIQQVMNLLSNYGLTGAINTLASGDIGAFLSLSDITATSSGQLWSELGKISALAAGLGLYNLTSLMEDTIRQMRKKVDQELLQNKTTKNEKTAKWKKELDNISKSIDKIINVVATAKGVIDAVSAII